MAKVRVPVLGTIGKSIRIDPNATVGATIGVDFRIPDGTVPTLAELAALLAIEATTTIINNDGSFNGIIFESQIVDGPILARVAELETITGLWTWQNDLQIAGPNAINWLDADSVVREMLVLKGGAGVEVERVELEVLDSVGTTSTTYVARTGATIAGSNFTVGDEYLVFCSAVGECNTSIVTGNRIRLTLNGGGMAGAEMEFEGGGASITTGFPFEFMSTFTYAAGDLQLQHRLNGAGVGTILTNEVRMLCVNLTDIGTDNFKKSISQATINLLDTSYKDLGASITIGNGIDDYIVFFCVQFENSSGGTTSFDIAIDDGSTQIQWFETEIENTTDIYNRVGMFVHQGGASTTYKPVGRITNVGATGDVIFSSLVAIRLNAFEQHEINIVVDPADPANANEYSLASDSFTSTAPTSDWAFFGRIVESWNLSGFSGGTKVQTNIAGAGLLDTAWDTDVRRRSNDNANDFESKLQYPTTVKNVANGATVVVDQRHIPAPAFATNVITESLLVSFSWKTLGQDVFSVGNPLFRLDLLGTAVRIPDSTGTAYRDDSHDGIDFNSAFTGTIDWNIIGLTSIQAGGVDLDVDALTATSYGAILEANLLDKSVAEIVSDLWTFSGLQMANAAGAAVLNEAATAINPTLVPNRANPGTGIGWAATDQLVHIAGDIEAVRYSEASSHIIVDSEVHTGITAGTTQTQADGFQLLSSHNEVATVANTNDTVVAPLAAVGRVLTIVNNGANTLQIFPAVDDDMGAGVDTAITLAAGGKLWFRAYDAITWVQFV